MSAVLLCLICAGALLYSAEAQDAYNELPDNYKKGVDLVWKQLSSHAGVQHHFLFYRSVAKTDIESGFGVRYIYHNFHLRPTRCAKGTAETDLQRCPFRSDRPLMDCAVCYKMLADEIENEPKPYVHCIQRPKLTQQMTTARLDHCRKMAYNSGAPTLLAVSTE
uniref:Retinoic acid receptor responder protein 2 n=1 Tax=Myripristis murdjan TaxID=586833 RepID=A0A667ZPX6_9TELE